jgi:hypothetical protein
MRDIKGWTTTIATWTTIFGAVAGGAFALYQFIENSSSARVKETLELIDRFYSPPQSTSMSRIVNFWLPRHNDLVAKAQAGEDQLSAYVIENFESGGLTDDASVIVNFFDRLRACTCTHLCDDEMVHYFFTTSAYNMFGLAYPFIVEQRKTDPNYGEGLERLARTRNDNSGFRGVYCSNGS